MQKNLNQYALKRYETALHSMRSLLQGDWQYIKANKFASEHQISADFFHALVKLDAVKVQGSARKREYKATNKLVGLQAETVLRVCRQVSHPAQAKAESVQLEEGKLAPPSLDFLPEVDDQLPWEAQPLPYKTISIDGIVFTFSASGKPKGDVSGYLDLMFEAFKAQL